MTAPPKLSYAITLMFYDLYYLDYQKLIIVSLCEYKTKYHISLKKSCFYYVIDIHEMYHIMKLPNATQTVNSQNLTLI